MKFYITTSIAYVNSKPHIGFAMETIQADCLARYHRLKGDDTFYLTGTDEHGMKIHQTAKEMGKETQELADENAAKFKALKELLNLSNNDFIRTTNEKHKKGAQKIWEKLVEAGDIYKSKYEGFYCVGCEAFITEKDLVDGKCPNHLKEPETIEEENYFFKLSKYSKQIVDLIEKDELKVLPESRKNEILNMAKEGFKDVSFSRPKEALSWGVKVPNDPNQIMYVWCDALSNYLTGIDYTNNGEKFKKYWPADVHLIGKDILRFHAGIWIGMLISAKVPIPKAVYVHGFITSEGKKMSKSLGNVVDPVEIVEKFGVDALRYYLLREIPTTDDGDFSLERFKKLYNSNLANNLGNLLNRVIAMTEKYFNGKIEAQVEDKDFAKKITDIHQKYEEEIEKFDLREALETVLKLIDLANAFIDKEKPWELAKNDQGKLERVMYILLQTLRQISVMLLPFIPQAAEKIANQLQISLDKPIEKLNKWDEIDFKVKKAEPLFPRIEE